MDLYTSGRYAAANPDWHDADAAHKARVVAETLRWLGLSPATVVDVGCGAGGVLRHLKAALDPVLPDTLWEGFDPAPEAVARARRTEGERLGFVEGDFLASERRVDLVLCLDVVEHVPDEVAFLEALRGKAEHFLFRLPLDLSALDAIRPHRLLSARHQWGHRHFWTRDLALDLLRACGYRVEHERYDRLPPQVDSVRRRWAERVRRLGMRAVPHAAVRALGGFSLLVYARPDR